MSDQLRIVATGDNHLGRHHARMPPARLAERRVRLRAGLGAAVERALGWPAHLVLLAGDVFDSPAPSNADLAFVAGRLRQLREAGIAVCAVGGNHDTPSSRTVQGGVAPLAPLARLDALTYFGEPLLGVRDLELNGATWRIGGLAPRPGDVRTDPLAALLAPEGVGVRLFLTHGALEGHGVPEREPVLRTANAQRLPALRLAIAGHLHAHTVVRTGGAVLVAPGATEWITHGETRSLPGFAEIELAGDSEVAVRHVPVAPQPRLTLSLDAAEGEDPHAAGRALLERHADPHALARLRVHGELPRERYAALGLRSLQELGAALYFHLDLDASGLGVCDPFARDAARGVRASEPEEIAAVAAELIGAATDPEERARWAEARDALLVHYR